MFGIKQRFKFLEGSLEKWLSELKVRYTLHVMLYTVFPSKDATHSHTQ